MLLLQHWHSRADARWKRGAEMGNNDNQPFPTSQDVKEPQFPMRKLYTNYALSVVTKDYSISLLTITQHEGGPQCQGSPPVPQGPETGATNMDHGERSMIGPCDNLMGGTDEKDYIRTLITIISRIPCLVLYIQ
jgi:hypothetical protein